MRRVALVFALALCACVPPSVARDSGVEDAGSIDSGVTFDAGVVTSTLVVKYPAGTHTLSVRGNRAPFSWTSGVPMQQLDAQTWTLTVTTPISLEPTPVTARCAGTTTRWTPWGLPECSGQRRPTGAGVMHS